MIDKKFFKKYQKQLVWFINTQIGRWFFCVDKEIKNIHEVLPNALSYNKCLRRFGKDNWKWEQTTCFRTHNKYAKLINYRLRHFQRLGYLIPAVLKPELGMAMLMFIPLTVTTFYPDAGTGNTTVDGLVVRKSVDETFSTIRSGAGTTVYATLANLSMNFSSSATNNQYSQSSRCLATFDTSVIDTDDVSNAVFSVYGSGKSNGLGSSGLHICSSSPNSDNTLITSDYSQLGSTSFGSVAYADYNTSGYSDITLNASGESNINKTGISRFGLRIGWDMLNDTTGLTWASSTNTGFTFYHADQAGTTNDPKLVVTHSVAVSDTGNFFQLF